MIRNSIGWTILNVLGLDPEPFNDWHSYKSMDQYQRAISAQNANLALRAVREKAMRTEMNQYKDQISPGRTSTVSPPVFTNTQWDDLCREIFVQVAEMSKTKGAEYSGDSDRLRNFRQCASDFGVPKELIWGVYAKKHWDAITTYVKDKATGRERVRSEPISGRILDLIVYLLLLQAMVEESNEAALPRSGGPLP